jgi:hypothetical protein
MWTPDAWDMLLKNTNLYEANNWGGNWAAFKKTSMQDLFNAVGILLLMSVIRIRDKKLYWSKKVCGGMLRQHAMAAVMPQKKFFHVCSMMHVVDFTNLDPDSLHKIYDKAKPIMALINQQCCAGVNWWPGRILTIDEAMRAYRGKRCRIMAFMPDKPIKRGLKLYMLSDADTGMVLCFILAAGDADVSEWDPVDLCAPGGGEEPFKAEGKMTFMCLRLMRAGGILGKGHIVATDNAYTCGELAMHCPP